MARLTAKVDSDGIRVPDGFTGSVDVWFGEHRGWSFTASEPGQHVAWPRPMRGFLKGWSQVRLVCEDVVIHTERVVFGPEPDEMQMLDRHGLPVIIDKWGLIQRPFEFRAEGLVASLAADAERIMDSLGNDCGVRSWISFGTLLGAARGGKAIGHDSDIDLCYLSTKSTPAEMTVELWEIGRVLRAAGWKVLHKSGSFLTVEVMAADGASVGIDVYATFHLDGLFYETATVRAPVPLSAVLPITPIEFEGRMLNGPASPERLLEISYGTNWRVPDPSFRHEPGPEILDRFDGWFGHLWRQRRDWRSLNASRPAQTDVLASDFAVWVNSLVPRGHRVVEVGAGNGEDAYALATSGYRVLALDYAFGSRRKFPEHPHLTRSGLNLYDPRDVLTRGALLARSGRPHVLCARDVLETLTEQGLRNFLDLVQLGMRPGGVLALEGHAWSAPTLAARPAEGAGGRIHRLDPHEVLRRAEGVGGTVTHVEGLREAARVLTSDRVETPVRWRMVLTWPTPTTIAGEDLA